jgi:hypothetical protein
MSKRVDFVWLEGFLEEPVARRLLPVAALDTNQAVFKVAGGNALFWDRMKDRNASAGAGLVVVALGDLEQEKCAPGLLKKHLPRGSAHSLVVRIAVRMLESWLLADVDTMAAFLGAPLAKLPMNPDELENPKLVIVNLARRHGSKTLRADLVPETGSMGIVGKGYRPRMEDYIRRKWRPLVAAQRSESLRRALRALKELAHSQ